MSNLVIGVLSYNMPKLTDRLFEQLYLQVQMPVNYIILDNGSLPERVSKYTTHRVNKNSRLTGGMNHILDIAKKYNPEYIWLCTNDIDLVTNIDPMLDMIQKIEKDPDDNIGIVHPSLVKPVPNYYYDWMIKVPGKENKTGITKNHCTYDIIAPLFTKAALDAINWKFNPDFEYGWGIDWESSWIIRNKRLSIAVDFDVLIKHYTSITYDSGNDLEFKNKQDYYKIAGENMNKVLSKKYGDNWSQIFQTPLSHEL